MTRSVQQKRCRMHHQARSYFRFFLARGDSSQNRGNRLRSMADSSTNRGNRQLPESFLSNLRLSKAGIGRICLKNLRLSGVPVTVSHARLKRVRDNPAAHTFHQSACLSQHACCCAYSRESVRVQNPVINRAELDHGRSAMGNTCFWTCLDRES